VSEEVWTPAEQTRALKRIEEKVDGLTLALPQTYVPATLWEQRNTHVDFVIAGLGREIGDLRGELRAKRAPWWSVAAVVIAAAALLWSMFGG